MSDSVIVVEGDGAPAQPPFAGPFSRTIGAVGATLILAAFVLPAMQGKSLSVLLGERLEEVATEKGGAKHQEMVMNFLPEETYTFKVDRRSLAPPEEPPDAPVRGPAAPARPGGAPPARESTSETEVAGIGASPIQLLCAVVVALDAWRAPGEAEFRRWVLVAAFLLGLLLHGMICLCVGVSGRGTPIAAAGVGFLLGSAVSFLGAIVATAVALHRAGHDVAAILDPRGGAFILGGVLLTVMGSLVACRKDGWWKIALTAILPLAAAGGLAYWALWA